MNIILSQKVQKKLQKLEEEKKAKVISSFLELAKNPYTGKKLVGKYDGYFSLRSWPFKIIYEVKDKKNGNFIHIIEIG